MFCYFQLVKYQVISISSLRGFRKCVSTINLTWIIYMFFPPIISYSVLKLKNHFPSSGTSIWTSFTWWMKLVKSPFQSSQMYYLALLKQNSNAILKRKIHLRFKNWDRNTQWHKTTLSIQMKQKHGKEST